MRDPVKLINFTRYLKETKRYELAIQYAEMIDPEFIKNEVLRITTFEALLLLEKYERYIELHDQYLLINPQNATTYNNKGFALKKLFRYQEAIECYDRGLSFNPSSEALLDNKGLALAEMGQYQAALECFNKAIESAPQSKTAFNNKGSVLIKMGRFEEAIQALDQAILNDSTSANEHKHKAFAFHKLGRLSEALAEYEISLKFEPQYIEAEACRALTFFDMKDFENCYESVKNLSYMRQQGYLKGFSQLQVPYLDRCLKKLLEVFTSTDYVSSDNIVCRGFYEVVEILANGNHGADCMKRLDCLVFEMESFDTQMFCSNQIKI